MLKILILSLLFPFANSIADSNQYSKKDTSSLFEIHFNCFFSEDKVTMKINNCTILRDANITSYWIWGGCRSPYMFSFYKQDSIIVIKKSISTSTGTGPNDDNFEGYNNLVTKKMFSRRIRGNKLRLKIWINNNKKSYTLFLSKGKFIIIDKLPNTSLSIYQKDNVGYD